MEKTDISQVKTVIECEKESNPILSLIINEALSEMVEPFCFGRLPYNNESV